MEIITDCKHKLYCFLSSTKELRFVYCAPEGRQAGWLTVDLVCLCAKPVATFVFNDSCVLSVGSSTSMKLNLKNTFNRRRDIYFIFYLMITFRFCIVDVLKI